MKSLVKLLLCASIIGVDAEPNPPNWDGRRVKIFDPSHSAQKTVDDIFHDVGGSCDHGQWSDNRYVVMFKKGNHHVNVRVGYYTQILGLGDKPTDVTLSSL